MIQLSFKSVVDSAVLNHMILNLIRFFLDDIFFSNFLRRSSSCRSNEFRTKYRNTRPQYNNNPRYNTRYNQQQEYDLNDEDKQEFVPEVTKDTTDTKNSKESVPEKESKSGMVPIKKSSIINGNSSGWSNVVRKARQQDNKKKN